MDFGDDFRVREWGEDREHEDEEAEEEHGDHSGRAVECGVVENGLDVIVEWSSAEDLSWLSEGLLLAQ
jgi:hypothetical protein